jgi:hypothetical protein
VAGSRVNENVNAPGTSLSPVTGNQPNSLCGTEKHALPGCAASAGEGARRCGANGRIAAPGGQNRCRVRLRLRGSIPLLKVGVGKIFFRLWGGTLLHFYCTPSENPIESMERVKGIEPTTYLHQRAQVCIYE